MESHLNFPSFHKIILLLNLMMGFVWHKKTRQTDIGKTQMQVHVNFDPILM